MAPNVEVRQKITSEIILTICVVVGATISLSLPCALHTNVKVRQRIVNDAGVVIPALSLV